ncbi:YbaK/EbsC family protein [Chelatococcus sp. SYSU_G07232]|uniref:YbaK/EbsC family protein n=1 Tax=Chelatococcus albus TaxID=3047466 RepID=A0ABT7ALF6_9HYPH|nr:YbaK/EbsC family protein [Chelatococcus sp. SYSU_G07232]MDJ1160193.1 YbaK/EbsC family protein [Chelatococcus sp. SYSU_G07232]
MAIAITLAQYLGKQGISYDILEHPRTQTSARTAEACHVPGDRLAKGVVLKGENDYVLAVLPASCHISFSELRALLGEDVRMVDEPEMGMLFRDCEQGAVPAIGAAYGLRVVMDDSLANEPEVFIEGGDHSSIVRLTGASFNKLMADARHGRFAAHM